MNKKIQPISLILLILFFTISPLTNTMQKKKGGFNQLTKKINKVAKEKRIYPMASALGSLAAMVMAMFFRDNVQWENVELHDKVLQGFYYSSLFGSVSLSITSLFEECKGLWDSIKKPFFVKKVKTEELFF